MNNQRSVVKRKRKPMPYERRKSLNGFLFCLPWVIGLIYFFTLPFFEAIVYSLSRISFSPTGIRLSFIGLNNYMSAFSSDTAFLRSMTDAAYTTIYQLPMILVFSMCLSLTLNTRFVGRTFVRGIFFLPVIIASGVVMNVLNGDTVSTSMMSGSRSSVLFQGIEFGQMLLKMGMPDKLADTLMNVVNGIFALVWRSGVQTLLLVSGLQSVPKMVYESAQIEGATSWEIFWKITLPLISPIVVLTTFFTLIDLATSSSNQMVRLVLTASRNAKLDYSAMSSLSWSAVVLLVAGVLLVLFRKHIYYMDDRG